MYSVVNLAAILPAQEMQVKTKIMKAIKKLPRTCRVQPGFGPAFAGGLQSGNAALAQAYRVISHEDESPLLGCWPKTL